MASPLLTCKSSPFSIFENFYFLFSVDSFQKLHGVQESKLEAAKVVSLIKHGRKSTSVFTLCIGTP